MTPAEAREWKATIESSFLWPPEAKVIGVQSLGRHGESLPPDREDEEVGVQFLVQTNMFPESYEVFEAGLRALLDTLFTIAGPKGVVMPEIVNGLASGTKWTRL